MGADIHNVYRLIPNLPERRVGDTVWMGPRDKFKGMARMVVARIVPHRAMVLVLPGDSARVLEQSRASSKMMLTLKRLAEQSRDE